MLILVYFQLLCKAVSQLSLKEKEMKLGGNESAAMIGKSLANMARPQFQKPVVIKLVLESKQALLSFFPSKRVETQYLGGRRREKTKIGNETINFLFPIKV